MLCQSIKREQWVDKLKASLLAVPYVHMTFTLPHQLNMLARLNKSLLYDLILKTSWNTVRSIGKYIGVTFGMTSILHTFGSDMKYHIHVHALVTFGGLNETGQWIYPPTKNKLAKYRTICALYKELFLEALKNEQLIQSIHYPQDYDSLLHQVSKIRWVVHSTYPTMDTNLIENYLAKYINRVAITNNRLTYIKENQSVVLMYNDYAQQVSGQAAPKAFKQMDPLSAIHQIMQHVLPPYFQKSRKYGLHHPSSKMMTNIPQAFRRNNQTIRSLFEIITHLMKLHPFECQHCHSKNYVITFFDPVRNHSTLKVSASSLKSPPYKIAPATSNISAITPVNAGTSVSAI